MELMTPDQAKTFEATMEMNLSFGVPGIGNFRINIFRQRGSISIVVRWHPRQHPGASIRSGCRNVLAT